MSEQEVLEGGGARLIQFKDDLHTKWFELQQDKRSNEQHAYLNKPLYDSIVSLGHEALEYLKGIAPASIWIDPIMESLHDTELKSWTADDIVKIGAPPKPYYAMEKEKAQNVITQDINKLANRIHQAGMSLIEARGEYAGCNISGSASKLTSLNTGVLKYCTGTLALRKKRGWVFGNKIEHRPGAADDHAMVIEIEPTEKGYDLDIDYTESGDQNWAYRLAGVIEFIRGKGGTCGDWGGPFATCKVKDASEEDMVDLALMISQLKDIDLLPRQCIPMAFEQSLKQAAVLKQVKPETAIWKQPWDKVDFVEPVLSCKAEYKAEHLREMNEQERRRGERRLRVLAGRATGEINDTATWARLQFLESLADPCDKDVYQKLFLTRIHDDIEYQCGLLRTHGELYKWCETLQEELKGEGEQAAKDLVQRCPPQPIILQLEQAEPPPYCGWEMNMVNQVCEMAGDKECLEIIAEIKERWAQKS